MLCYTKSRVSMLGPWKILRAPFEWSPAPGIHAGSPPPTPAGFCAEAPNSHLLPTQVLVSESSNRFRWEGRERQESSGLTCQAEAVRLLFSSPQRAVERPIPEAYLNLMSWNRTWKMMRTEPRPLRSRMGESAPGQGQVGTHPSCLRLLSARTCPVPNQMHLPVL